jgi:hypothetical protein
MTQREVLCPRRCSDRIRLNEAEPVDGVLEREWAEKAARDREFPESV